jgi:hypothetical protein
MIGDYMTWEWDHMIKWKNLTNFQLSSMTGNPVILFSTRASNAATIYIDTHKNYTSQLNNIYTIQTITYKKR